MIKKMYKKPQTDKVTLEPKEVNMQRALGVSNGAGDNESHDNMVASAPRKS